MKVITDKEVRVTTMGGTAVLFQPGVEREVADEIGLLAIQMGAKQVGDAPIQTEVVVEDEPEVVEEIEIQLTDQDLIDCLEGLIEDGDPENFKADGAPKAQVVNKLMGRAVSSEERDAAWEQVLNS